MASKKNDSAKKAKYFCENCGSEVAAKARFCPSCGKFFAAVRCPSCGHTGTVKDFALGCPVCHYAMSHSEIYGDEDSETSLDGRKHRLSGKSRRAIDRAFSEHEKRTGGNTDSGAPAWLFVVSIAVLVIMFVLLFFRCKEF
ncbi:zinc ribbon domain-containing protein [uncultured Treponema sp.]|uniref:zinc ribbon domain-containing protein n=1 Tax=uncultured Treponema sp. TaxID=162155 RepID=UPI0025982990|nr:zinc ribbon domain-containing protein [uncultured Treponema sp.]